MAKRMIEGTPSMSAVCCGVTRPLGFNGQWMARRYWRPRMRQARFWLKRMPLLESVRVSV